ncbi:MAG: hypothetical protein Kow0068_14300 [Marinilabiliales bacterium]
MNIKYIITVIFGILIFFEVSSQNVKVVISGLRNTKGQIVMGIFKDDESFNEEKPFMNKVFPKTNIKDNVLICSLTLKPGVYGISILDDENCDGEMNYNLLGIPLEGYGFSNYCHKGLTKPHFDNFKFMVTNTETRKILIKVQYM